MYPIGSANQLFKDFTIYFIREEHLRRVHGKKKVTLKNKIFQERDHLLPNRTL